MKFALIFLFATLIPSRAEWSTFESVWQQSKEEAYSFEGTIKTIYVDEEHDRITLRMKPLKGDSTEEFNVCEDNVESARNQRVESDKMNLIRQAFASGSPVRVGFGGSFERCLSTVRYLKNIASDQVEI
jgi:hypothetical protein